MSPTFAAWGMFGLPVINPSICRKVAKVTDRDHARKLWTETEKLLGETFLS